MRMRPLHVSCLNEPRNPLSYRHLSFHFVSSSRCFLLVVENPQAQVREVSVSETENVEVLNGALFMTRTRPTESADYVPERSFPLVVPIPKPEPFIESTGHIPDEGGNTLFI